MRRSRLARINWMLLATTGILCAMGLLALWSFSPPDWGDPKVIETRFVRQAAFLMVALLLLGIALVPNPLHARRLSWFFYGFCILALVGLLVFGKFTRGARGWFRIGPVTFQPAEFAKIATVLVLARLLMYAKNTRRWWGLLPPLGVAAVPTALIFLQPDLGTSILFGPVVLAMLFASGARIRHLLILGLVAIVAAAGAFFFVMKPYQRSRLLSFAVPARVEKWERYQQDQSIKACATGGWTGRGLGESALGLSFYIPDRHNDFVFSILAEELGFLGSLFLLLLYALFLYQALRMAYHSRDPFGRLVIVGLSTFLACQLYINVGMTIGVAPVTGLTLPFVSYGGCSLLATILSVGLVLNIGSRWSPSFGSDLRDASVEMRSFAPHDRLRGLL